MKIQRTRTGFWPPNIGDHSASEIERAHRLMSYAEEFEDRWFWETDASGRLTYLSRNVAEQVEMLGVKTVGEQLTKVFRLEEGGTQHSRSLNFQIVSRSSFANYAVRGVKGLSESWWSMSGRPWFDANGEYRGFVGSGTDLAKTRKQEATIRRLAVTDSLTGLANRQQMQENLERLHLNRIEADPHCALMMLDLDGFKGVNDTLGHPVGDSLLVQVAERLSSVVSDLGIVGRLGGDEFQILIPGQVGRDSLSELGSRIIDEISEPYCFGGHSVTISCSIGIALLDPDGTPEKLVRNADIALYAAKESGRATHLFFENAMLARATRRKKLEDDLRIALSSGQLNLLYQPVVATRSEKLSGFEALLRWTHPTEGDISPSEFISVAEDSGLIQQIGDWVIRTAVEAIASLPEDLRVAVNVSAVQFMNPALISTVANAIAEHQIDPSRLELEITESVFLDSQEKSQRTFRALKGLGVRLALDDFGTGYSSLSYLQNAPFDKIKIDQSFVRGAVDPRSRNAAIIESIVGLSKALNMETTAEGLEHQDEIELIRKLGCSHIQGFVYGPPLDLTGLLPELGTGLRRMRAIGPKRSRSPRTDLVRIVSMAVNDNQKSVVIRNISETGALIQDVGFTQQMVGVTVLLELERDQLLEAKVRWVGEGRAGVEFYQPIPLSEMKM